MTIFIGTGTSQQRVSRKNRFNRSALITLDQVWQQIASSLPQSDQQTAQTLLAQWRGDDERRSFAAMKDLASELARTLRDLSSRENYFYRLPSDDENKNIARVIYQSNVPSSSVGFSDPKFFQELGHPRNKRWEFESVTSQALAEAMVGVPEMRTTFEAALKRRAEQEYLLMNMVKGAMLDAARIAGNTKLGIAVRGTGLLAHMGIESGDPTKAQEFKNKTSKEDDVYLCDELQWKDLGAVVHYDPRLAWSSQKAEVHAKGNMPPMFPAPANESDWAKKKEYIQLRIAHGSFYPKQLAAPNWEKLKATFLSRSKEYMEEDYEYRKGHYAPYCDLAGPFIRLKARPDANMVGDHDLFAFTTEAYGVFAVEQTIQITQAQEALQASHAFQAQHGGIYYWQPSTSFNSGIKAKIMGAHSADGDEPLVYICPDRTVTAAFYDPTNNRLNSVWDTTSTKWMAKTHSGGLLLNPPALKDDD